MTRKTESGWVIEIRSNRQGETTGREELYRAATIRKAGLDPESDPDGYDLHPGTRNSDILRSMHRPDRVLRVGYRVR